MRRLTQFVKQVFSITDRPQLPATALEMTLHDAMRICTGRVRSDVGAGRRQVGVCRYASESDLYEQWHRLDRAVRHTANLTVVLVLADFLRSNLRDIVRRTRLAHRLVIVPQAGHWPGVDSFGDLALSAGSLGWKSIELCRNLHEAPVPCATVSCQEERVILMLPLNTSICGVA